MKYFSKDKQGFTLIEVLISVVIILIALITSIALVSFSVSSIKTNKAKIIAFGLAQEGFEIIKNIRDNNWKLGKTGLNDWRDNLPVGAYRLQYDFETLLSFSEIPLKINNNGFYQYNTGEDTPFYRKATIENINTDQIKIVLEITWQESGRNDFLRAETRLYNWQKE